MGKVNVNTWNATSIGTLAALCIGVALSGIIEITFEVGFVGKYKSLRGTGICRVIRQWNYDIQ